MSYYQETEIPIRVIKNMNIEKVKKSWRGLPKRARRVIGLSILGVILIFSQSYFFSGYEAHVINVTARICRYSETRTPGYWKNHEEVYEQYLPISLGPTPIDTVEAAEEIFNNATAVDMADKLRAHLLAMKFNILHYGVGEYYVIGWGTVDFVVALADDLLTPEYGTREEMEEVKDVLDYVSNLHRLTYCLDINPGFEPTFAIEGAVEPSEEIVEMAAILSLEPEVAGAFIINEQETVASGEITEDTSVEEPISEAGPITEEALVESPTEEQGIVEEVVETVGDAVETVIETVVDVVENILGLSNENVSNEPVSEEEIPTTLEESIEPPIEIPPQPIESPVTE